ncbi:Dimethylamine methyltransferase corrinoid protein [Methanosarcina lacustris Z-7289]|uniref:Dimethylamine methyltransferase corrinoid protein n=1 Tax=Methanosarcina lacustris Z-7289 TaxID=1434111 RepID=A0A0E3S3M0_9EURY|nr:Dimethylamine methyltransferase corrinoid protein [Methanosarcina lacustris Z-7289]
MADIEGLLHEVADAVISCKKEKLLDIRINSCEVFRKQIA